MIDCELVVANMDGTSLTLFPLFVLWCFVSVSAYTPVCKPFTGEYHGPALPDLPVVFSTSLEGNVFNKNYTFSVEEHYDNTTDQLATSYMSNRRHYYTVTNYRKDERIVVDMMQRKCWVSNASDARFGSMRRPTYDKDGHEHITRVSDFFHFGKQYNETFIGEEQVRGIRVWHWQSCASHVNYSYILDWYFSVPSWNPAGGKSPIPVRSVINGTGISNRTHKFHSFYHVYDFFNFKAGHPPPERFQPPPGIFCTKRDHGQTPPKLPKWFSNDVEFINITGKTVRTMRTHYDVERKLSRFEYQPRRHGDGMQRIVDIHDFNTGVSYSINAETYNCTMKPLNDSYDSEHDGDEDVHMKSPLHLFWRDPDNLRYQGVGLTRQIETNVWIQNASWHGHSRTINYIREIHTSRPEWHTSAGQIKDQSEVPVFIRYFGSDGNVRGSMNIFNFDGESPKLPLFDVGACFLWDKSERRIATFYFDGDFKQLVATQNTLFLNTLLDTISKLLGISLLRMSETKVYGYKKMIGASLTILKRPTMEGITVKMAHKEPTLDYAFRMLKALVENGKLKVMLPKSTKPLVAKSFYESEIYDHKNPGKPKKKKDSKVSPVGVAIGSILLGLLIGVLICFLVLKRRGVNLFSYQRQNNEI